MTPPRIVIRLTAARDIDAQADFLARKREPLGERFLVAVNETIEAIVSISTVMDSVWPSRFAQLL